MFVKDASLLGFLVIMARMVGLFIFIPFFGERAISQIIKITFVFWTTLCLWFVVPVKLMEIQSMLIIIGILISELFFGLIIGFIARVVFLGIEFAGSLMDMQMGLSVAASFDPSTGGQTTLMARIMYFYGLLIFLLIDGHHLVLSALVSSYKVVPLASSVFYELTLLQIGGLGGQMFLIGLTLSLPILVVIFMLDFALGLLARLAPQVNVFFLGFQIKPVLGLFVFLFMSVLLVSKISGVFEKMIEQIFVFLNDIKVS